MRLVGVRLPESAGCRFYLTDISPAPLDAYAVAQVHAERWQVELLFEELKSHYRLDLLQAVRERLRRTTYRVPELRWAALFAAAAPAILDIVLLPPRVSNVIARRLEPMLLDEAPDPNRSRLLLVERVERGSAWVWFHAGQTLT